ncbi:MAG: ABC transporter ATP-binding protein [Lachnospiraceae bacterium]
MKLIFKSLGRNFKAVFLITLLLVVQAFCDLSLPSYTSDIVDIGIQQKGLEHAAMDSMQAETMENICLFLEEKDADKVKACYEKKGDLYERTAEDEDTIEELDSILSVPMVMLQKAGESDQFDLEQVKQALKAGMMTQEDLLKMKDQALEKFEGVSDSIIQQGALQFVQKEYEAMGKDMDDIQMDYLLHTGGKMLLMTLVMVVAAILAGFFAARTAAKIGMDLREGIFKKVLSFHNTEMDRFSTASLITRSTNDIQQIQMVCVMLLRMVMYAPILGIGGVVKVLTTKTNMSWIIVAAVASIFFLVLVLMVIAMPKFKKMQSLVDRMNLVSREILTGIPVIRAFSREKNEEERFDVANKNLMKTQLFTNRVMTFMMPIMMLIMNGVSVLIVWVGSNGVDAGTIQVGDMIAFMTYTMQIVMSFLMLTMVSVMLPRAGVAGDRIQEVLDVEVSVADPKVPKAEEKTFAGELTFDDVSFRYDGADEDALEHISFTAKPGQTTAIIGSTGCGKSTLVNLIPRFYDVTGGKIAMDGVDIREMSQHKLHSLIGLVPQKGILFSGDIASNLKFGGDDITDEKMKQAAEIAQATEFIDAKPQGYESPIAQGGTNVSGGQKQRLSIARALAKTPKVCVFDDSFSALDYKTDLKLRKELHQKLSDATIVIVAQRISTILHADQILMLDDGKIVGKGTHEELMQTCEPYREIAYSQLSEEELKGGHSDGRN